MGLTFASIVFPKSLVANSQPKGRGGDAGVSYQKWSEDYQKLIWILEVMRAYFYDKVRQYRVADLEMALFIMRQ